MIKLLELLSIEFSPEATAATIGTKRDRLIKKITGNNDPYRELKHHSNIQALRMLPEAREFVEATERIMRDSKPPASCRYSETL